MDAHDGFPSDGPEKPLLTPETPKPRKRRRSRRHNRTERALRRATLEGLMALANLHLLFWPTNGAQASELRWGIVRDFPYPLPIHLVLWPIQGSHALPWTDLQVNTSEATHWAITPLLPVPQLVTWKHDAVPLQVTGNISVLLPSTGSSIPVALHRLNKTVSLHSWTRPICITKNSSSVDCAVLAPFAINQLPHGTLGIYPNETYLYPGNMGIEMLSFLAYEKVASKASRHPYAEFKQLLEYPPTDATLRTAVWAATAGPSPLPPCHHTPWILSPLQVCSSGFPRTGQLFLDTVLYFWDGRPGPYLVAPVPVPVKGRPQTHLWKVGLAFGDTRVWVDTYSASSDRFEHPDLMSKWADILQTAQPCLHSKKVCTNFTAQVQTGPNAFFMLCNDTKMDGKSSYGFTVNCTNPLFTNTLNATILGEWGNNVTVFLLKVPHFTTHPVKSERFALSRADALIQDMLETDKAKRGRRDLGATDLLALFNLAMNVIEEMQIHQLQNQVAFLASSLQQFMVQNGLAWRHQEYVDKAILERLSALAEVLEIVTQQQALMVRYMRLQCHYKYYPVCVTPIPYNDTAYKEVEEILKNATYINNITHELEQLDKVIAAMENATIEYTTRWDHWVTPSFFDWFKGLSLTDLYHWIAVALLSIVFIMLFLCCVPCIVQMLFRTLRRSLEALKAEIRLPL